MLALNNSRQVFQIKFSLLASLHVWLSKTIRNNMVVCIISLLASFYFLVILNLQLYPMFNYFLLLFDNFKLLRVIWDRGLGTNTSNSWRHSGVQGTDTTPSPSTLKAFSFSHFLFRWFVQTYLWTGRDLSHPVQQKKHLVRKTSTRCLWAKSLIWVGLLFDSLHYMNKLHGCNSETVQQKEKEHQSLWRKLAL